MILEYRYDYTGITQPGYRYFHETIPIPSIDTSDIKILEYRYDDTGITQNGYRYSILSRNDSHPYSQLFIMSWQSGLVKTILDSKNWIISSDVAVVIADKYPKAQQHYLVLPKQQIASIFELNKSHLELLEELHLLARNIIEVRGEKLSNFQIGFHAEPSMQHLHLHVISLDFVSNCLKTKKHWNSFNTQLFLPYQTLYNQLLTEGCIARLTKDRLKELLDTPLKCNQCAFIAQNIPKLKEHLEKHFQ